MNWDVILPIILFIVGILCIVKGGDWFVDSASDIAEASGIPKFIIGATIVSVATTLPELIVSVIAASEGKVDMAIGNAVGSVTANMGLILALSLICIPMIMKRRDFLTKAVMLLGTMITLWIACFDGTLGIVGSIILFLIFLFYIYENVHGAKKHSENNEKKEFSTKSWIKAGIFFVLGAAGIVIGSRLLVDNGSILAELMGVPESVIALTMIAIGTSLPELVTAIVSISKHESSMSVGNVIGANLIDSALILPICALISGGSLPVTAQTISLDLPISMLIGGVILIPAMINEKFSRTQGIIAMVIYISYLVVVCTGAITF